MKLFLLNIFNKTLNFIIQQEEKLITLLML